MFIRVLKVLLVVWVILDLMERRCGHTYNSFANIRVLFLHVIDGVRRNKHLLKL